jgi:ubiquitin-protein ligase
MSIACINRIKKELDMLANDPGPGISAWPISDDDIIGNRSRWVSLRP